ncbi:hypothetical protein NQ318_006026 [Aromia moschata]|uniref:Uncharacterized protein n=1 Tax=Aromia moschata TaxID=1265417 RepID=A0AAV8Z355_9CUCU|nr:hypothetical protein NQ318_006026 [Aromia moschata]
MYCSSGGGGNSYGESCFTSSMLLAFVSAGFLSARRPVTMTRGYFRSDMTVSGPNVSFRMLSRASLAYGRIPTKGYEYGYDDYGAHTGDPSLDEYNRQHFKMPEGVQRFLTCFRNYVNEGLIFELQALYEHSWPKLTEDYFEKRPWPEESEVATLVDSDPKLCGLYA